MNTDPLCAGSSVFNYYTVETVQRIGADSFTPDNGVLLAKNKTAETNTCGYLCFTWVVDANPQNVNREDFRRPDGTPVMRTPAYYRQLNDALFHARDDPVPDDDERHGQRRRDGDRRRHGHGHPARDIGERSDEDVHRDLYRQPLSRTSATILKFARNGRTGRAYLSPPLQYALPAG
jgi:hypothetical protein